MIKIFGLEAQVAFGGAGLGEEVAEGVVVAGGCGGLGLVGEDFVDGAYLVFYVGVPAVGVGEEV